MKKSLSDKDILLLVVVLGLLVFVVVYFNVFMNFSNKAETLENQNRELQKEVTELKTYFEKMPQYKKQKAEAVEAIQTIVDGYPSDAREEDAIMVAVKMQEESKMLFNTIEISNSEFIYAVPAETVAAANMEGYMTEIDFASKDVSYFNKTDYSNLKASIEAIQNYSNKQDAKIGIQNIHYVKNDSDGTLNGIVEVIFYSIKGTDKEYKAPDISAYTSGTSDLFGLEAITE